MADAGAGRVVVARVGSERFALPVSAVREIVANPPVARIPGAPEAVRGIANVRGRLVTSVSGPLLLGLPAPLASEWLIVLSMYEGRVGLEVDEVEDVRDADSAAHRVLELEALIQPLLERS